MTRHLASKLDKEKQHIYRSIADPAMQQVKGECEDCCGFFKDGFSLTPAIWLCHGYAPLDFPMHWLLISL